MRVHHIAFRTADVARLEAFYTGVLGFTVARRQGDYSVWLDAGGALLMLERAEPGEPPVPHGSMELVAFAAPPEHEARLAAAGIAIEARTAFTVYFRDPDGRRIALSHYPLER
jgi:catechol 2,3-dioxygenase-like lactoylglutathione lyase family enzyme